MRRVKNPTDRNIETFVTKPLDFLQPTKPNGTAPHESRHTQGAYKDPRLLLALFMSVCPRYMTVIANSFKDIISERLWPQKMTKRVLGHSQLLVPSNSARNKQSFILQLFQYLVPNQEVCLGKDWRRRNCYFDKMSVECTWRAQWKT